jgi:hypothetical protein
MRSIPTESIPAAVLFTAPDGNPAVALVRCYCGYLDQGEKVLKALRSFGPLMADLMGPRSYLEMQAMLDEAWAPGRLNYWKTSLVAERRGH